MDSPELTRREFTFVGIASLASLDSGTITAQTSGESFATDRGTPFQDVAVIEGPRDERPAPDAEFFENKVFYAYRYIDEVTKASWYTTQNLDVWHPEPLGAADVATENGEAHAVSLVSRDGRLFVRRYS